MRIRNKPLQLAGASGLLHNGLSTIGAFEERAKYRKGLPGGTSVYRTDLLSYSAMFVGNSLYSISNKGTGGSIENDMLIQDVYSFAAEILENQPKETRDAAIAKTADFLAQRPEIKDNKDIIIQRLNEEIINLSRNPWFAEPEQQEVPSSLTNIERKMLEEGHELSDADKEFLRAHPDVAEALSDGMRDPRPELQPTSRGR